MMTELACLHSFFNKVPVTCNAQLVIGCHCPPVVGLLERVGRANATDFQLSTFKLACEAATYCEI